MEVMCYMTQMLLSETGAALGREWRICGIILGNTGFFLGLDRVEAVEVTFLKYATRSS